MGSKIISLAGCMMLFNFALVSHSFSLDLDALVGDKYKNINIVNIVISDSEFMEVKGFVLNFPSNDYNELKLMRSTYMASNLAINYLNNKYSTTEINYKKDIVNTDDLLLYSLCIKIKYSHQNRALHLCYNDEHEAFEAKQKIKDIKRKMSDKKLSKDQSLSLYEEIHKICKYGIINYELLYEYMKRGKVKKFNDLMLSVLNDDQVVYDYLYNGKSGIDEEFVDYYISFILRVNDYNGASNFKIEEALIIYNCIIGKHAIVFDLGKNEIGVGDGNFSNIMYKVSSLLNLSHWLSFHGLNREREELIKKFLASPQALKVLPVLSVNEKYSKEIADVYLIIDK